MSAATREKWRHRSGDRYMAVFADVWGNERDGFRLEWCRLGPLRTTRNLAERDGFREQDSDDFCIAVVRARRVVAVLWMDEDKAEKQAVLDELTGLLCD